MDFELNEDQRQIKMSVREFAEGEIAPHVREWDEAQHFPSELTSKLAEQGFMGVIFPEEYGGAGMGYVEYVAIIEELSRVDGSVGISIAAHDSLCSNHIFMFGKKEDKLGLRASETASVIFEDCRVPDANRLGPEGLGFIQAMQVLDGGRISIAALALGIGQGAYESAVRYSKERQQFGQSISNFQAIQFKLADMATQIEAARLLTYRAAALKDAGRKVTKESSMAKLFASEMSVKVCEEAIQIHGGYGYTKDYPPEKFWRDSKLCTIGEGTSEIQRIIIAREVLKQV